MSLDWRFNILGVGGLVGSGKTLLCIVLGKQAKDLGYDVKTNMQRCTFAEYVNPLQLWNLELQDCVLILDEAQTIIDSRNDPKNNRRLTYFGMQTRKRRVYMLFTSQMIGAVDTRLRDISNYRTLAERTRSGFRYTVFYSGFPLQKFGITFEDAKPYYALYDTEEVIYPIDMVNPSFYNFSQVEELSQKVPTKKAFIMLVKRATPYMTFDDISAMYDFLKVGMDKEARILFSGLDA